MLQQTVFFHEAPKAHLLALAAAWWQSLLTSLKQWRMAEPCGPGANAVGSDPAVRLERHAPCPPVIPEVAAVSSPPLPHHDISRVA